jgi:hypothetical protein
VTREHLPLKSCSSWDYISDSDGPAVARE